MRNIMKRAWELAKKAAVKFGGSAKQYISGALKQAWAETKAVVMSVREQIIERLNKVLNYTNESLECTEYRPCVKEWNKYGKSRTYIGAYEYRMKSKGWFYYQKLDFGYIDNVKNVYVPGRRWKNDITYIDRI